MFEIKPLDWFEGTKKSPQTASTRFCTYELNYSFPKFREQLKPFKPWPYIKDEITAR